MLAIENEHNKIHHLYALNHRNVDNVIEINIMLIIQLKTCSLIASINNSNVAYIFDRITTDEDIVDKIISRQSSPCPSQRDLRSQSGALNDGDDDFRVRGYESRPCGSTTYSDSGTDMDMETASVLDEDFTTPC